MDPLDLKDEFEDVDLDEQEHDSGELEAGAPEDEGDEQDTLKAEVEALKRQQAEAQQAQLRAQEEATEAQRQAALEAKESDLLKQRREALEKDDLDAFDKLDSELIDIRLERRTQRQATADADPEDALAPEAKAWIDRNPWFRSDAQRASKVKQIAAELEGQYDTNDPELYAEIDRRIAAEKPKPTASATRAGAVAGVNRGGGQPKKGGSEKLTRADLTKMAKYGLDPNNQDHRRGWLNRNASIG